MSKCANCNELVGEEWSANNGLCTTCARDEVSKADTNQASEDELGNILQSLTYNAIKNEIDISKHEYTYNTINKLLPTTKAAIQGLIRSEKLKLLAEVRDRVIGENDRGTITDPDSPSYGEPYESAMANKDEQRAELTKLEAEL